MQLKDSVNYQQHLQSWLSDSEDERKHRDGLIAIPFILASVGFVYEVQREGIPREIISASLTSKRIGLTLSLCVTFLLELLLVWATVPFYVFLHVSSVEVERVKEKIREIQAGQSASQVTGCFYRGCLRHHLTSFNPF